MSESVKKDDTLCVIVPVYNEQGAVGQVLEEWCQMLEGLSVDFRIVAYNDGSKDRTKEVLEELVARFPNRIKAVHKPNSGHGPTILQGYVENVDHYAWLFQMDSDNEMGSATFATLWNARNEADFLVAMRSGRQQAWPRKIISFVSRSVVKLFYGSNTVWDVNTPYRLMRAAAFAPFFKAIPADTFAPNVIISGLVARHKLRFFQCGAPHRDRQTGEVSIKKWKLLKAAMRSFFQTIRFAFLSH